MQKLLLVMFILLVFKIQSFGCEATDFKAELIQKIEQTYSTTCKIILVNTEKKSIIINCDNQKNYTISYDDKSIYFLTNTISKYPYMSQCWIDGQITNSCSLSLAIEKCQTWNMKD
jgi:hypothetical protein